MRHKGRYAAIGYVVSKFLVPIAKRQARKAARRKARGAANAARAHPARTSVAVGAAAGAIGWLLTRSRHGSELD